MIGDVPKGAPLRCRLHRHVGQADGGTMIFMCPRCGGSYWQSHRHREALRVVEWEADHRIGRGDESALGWAHERVAQIVGHDR